VVASWQSYLCLLFKLIKISLICLAWEPYELSFLQNFIKNNLCKVSRRRVRDRNQNPWSPRRDLRHWRPRLRLQEMGLETRLETPSLISWTAVPSKCSYEFFYNDVHVGLIQYCNVIIGSSPCAATNCFVVIMWCSCDMILLSFRVSNLLDVARFTSVNLLQ